MVRLILSGLLGSGLLLPLANVSRIFEAFDHHPEQVSAVGSLIPENVEGGFLPKQIMSKFVAVTNISIPQITPGPVFHDSPSVANFHSYLRSMSSANRSIISKISSGVVNIIQPPS